MQASLPDINTQFKTDKTKAISSCDWQNWDDAIGCIYSINALLPENYQVTISTAKYIDEMKANLFGICGFCEHEIPEFDSIPKYDVMLGKSVQLLLDKRSTKIWVCPDCHNENNLESTTTIIDKKQEPYYSKIIPRPPEYKQAFGGRTAYNRAMKDWFWNAMNELNHAMMKYRMEYKGKDETENPEFNEILDKAEGTGEE